MAKWGEGDPRWIVEERPDATNVNNWHWTEKNACAWSQDKLKELFKDFKIEGDKVNVNIADMETCEGEAIVNNRKGKLIFFYEWNLVLKWMSTEDKTIEGKINIPNLSEENDISEVDIEITLKDSNDEGEKVKHFLHTKGKDFIRERLKAYVTALKQEFTKGMILPKKDENQVITKNCKTAINVKAQMNTTIVSNNKSLGYKISTTTVKQHHKFQCRAQDFFNVFTTTEMVQAFTKGPVKLDSKKEGKFELFGGNIHGEFVDLSPTKIVQKWRCKHWPEGHFSEVILDISEKSDHTEVDLTQNGVPCSEEDSTKENWDRYYWDPIKRTFGFGYFM
ncbi:activator of 90 kDa heat shock protein ATPase homolog 1 [Diachasmimorpha longicaudata]|uniref:activator of 90 kDa heat shock protein ATPase homolog 1 n=1 Tax=Diachasmimorpha longicaudata TaxID=58733 RepID=UPI0030B86DC4